MNTVTTANIPMDNPMVKEIAWENMVNQGGLKIANNTLKEFDFMLKTKPNYTTKPHVFKDNKWQEVEWQDFREKGLLWRINRELLKKGLMICLILQDKVYKRTAPFETYFNSFSEEVDMDGQFRFNAYLNSIGKESQIF